MQKEVLDKWRALLSEFGWKYHEIYGLPIYSNIANGRVYFNTFPDISYGVIPIQLPDVDQNIVHRYLFKYSSNIYIGDLTGIWKHPAYKSSEIEYQVIPEKPMYDARCRRDVKKAWKEVIIKPMEKAEDFKQCMDDTADRHGKPHFNLWILEAVLRNFNGLLVWWKGIPIAGCIYSDEEDKIRFLNSASRTEFMPLMGNYAFMDYLIWEIAKGREVWLGNAPKELTGLKAWKAGFGAETRTFNLKFCEH